MDDDRPLDMLDLAVDSVLATSARARTGDRRLTFLRCDCSVQLTVHGVAELTADVEIYPRGHCAIVVQTRDRMGTCTTSEPCAATHLTLRPGLTRLIIRWPARLRPPARTAWVLL